MQFATALKGKAIITIVNPLGYFKVPIAMPRLLVQTEFADQSLVPPSSIVGDVRHVRGKLVPFGPTGGVPNAVRRFYAAGDKLHDGCHRKPHDVSTCIKPTNEG